MRPDKAGLASFERTCASGCVWTRPNLRGHVVERRLLQRVDAQRCELLQLSRMQPQHRLQLVFLFSVERALPLHHQHPPTLNRSSHRPDDHSRRPPSSRGLRASGAGLSSWLWLSVSPQMMHLEMQPVDDTLEQRHEAVTVRLRHLIAQLHGRAEPASPCFTPRSEHARQTPVSRGTVGDGLAPRRQDGGARAITRLWWAERVCLARPSARVQKGWHELPEAGAWSGAGSRGCRPCEAFGTVIRRCAATALRCALRVRARSLVQGFVLHAGGSRRMLDGWLERHAVSYAE